MIRFVRSLLLLLGLATLPACAAYEQRAELARAPALQAPQMVVPATAGKITTTRTVVVHFDSNSDEIRASAMQILYGASVDLRSTRVTSIRVTGYADAAGRRSHNQKLSERRAAAVAAQLGKLGLHAETVMVTGSGEAKAAPRHRRAADRRVEIVFEQVQDIAAAPAPAPTSIGNAAPLPQATTLAAMVQLPSPSQALVPPRSPEPLQSADKHAIKRDLVLDGTTWQPPPAA